MVDSELNSLMASSVSETPDPLNTPSQSALKYLTSLDLSDEDIEMLLGEAPGLSWADMKTDAQSFFFRLRRRVAMLICDDQELMDSVKQSLTISTEAAWLALVHAFGFNPGILAAAALKPIAVGLVISGADQLCQRSS